MWKLLTLLGSLILAAPSVAQQARIVSGSTKIYTERSVSSRVVEVVPPGTELVVFDCRSNYAGESVWCRVQGSGYVLEYKFRKEEPAVVRESIRSQKSSIDEYMTNEEQRTTGVYRLPHDEKEALARWLSQWYLRILALRPQQSAVGSTAYAGIGGGHWVIQAMESFGEYVKLEDGSLWEIAMIDRIYTMLWLPVTQITVLKASDPIGDYRYILINMDDGERAYAKYIGQ